MREGPNKEIYTEMRERVLHGSHQKIWYLVSVIYPVKREKNDNVTTLRRSESEDIVSESTNDGRIEQCSKCGNECGRSKISTLNMLYIAQRMLCGEKRPIWLT